MLPTYSKKCLLENKYSLTLIWVKKWLRFAVILSVLL